MVAKHVQHADGREGGTDGTVAPAAGEAATPADEAAPAAAGSFFFVAGLLGAISQLASSWLAQRIGRINTMVFTHIPSSIALMLAACGVALLVISLTLLAGALLCQPIALQSVRGQAATLSLVDAYGAQATLNALATQSAYQQQQSAAQAAQSAAAAQAQHAAGPPPRTRSSDW